MADEPNQQDAAEELALVLTNHGLQRMTARVLATLLFTEQPTITARASDQLWRRAWLIGSSQMR